VNTIFDTDETTAQSVQWQRSATLLAFTLACCAEYWTTASVSLTLTDLGGTLGASSDEASWALTIYTTAFAVGVALSHRLSVFLGNRKYLAACSVLYGLATIGCALSPNLPVFLVFRAIQGFAGGAFLVRTFVFLTQRIEIEHRAAVAVSFFIEIMIVGRIIPYVASGWMADNITWRLEFVFPALFAFVAAGLFLRFTPDYWRQADKSNDAIDSVGIALLAIGAAAFQTALSRGAIDDWFGSAFIRSFFVLGVVGNALFVFWQLSSWNKAPLLDLRYMKERTVYAGGTVSFVLGVLLSGSLYVIPQYLRTVESHSALQTGVLLGVSSAGAAIAVCLFRYAQPFTKRVGNRLIIATAFLASMISEFMFGHFLTPDTPDYVLWIPLFLNGVFIAFSTTSLGGAAFTLVAEQEISSARAIFYGFRQFGTSVGVTLAVVLIDRRSELHSARLLEGFFGRSLPLVSQSTNLSPETLKGLELLVRKQSLVLSFADIFNVMGVLAGLSLFVIPLLPSLKPTLVPAASRPPSPDGLSIVPKPQSAERA
jgi:EmrB/QacA subfamily drug resistance transporter